MADAAPQVEGLPHLRRILCDEAARTEREGLGCLYLEGCVSAADRALVDEEVAVLLAVAPGCRLLSALPTADGYIVNLRRAGRPTPTRSDTERDAWPSHS
jgi:hypothetical protein